MQFSTIVPLCFCDARILRRRNDEHPTPFSFALVIAEQQLLCDKFGANCLVSCTQKKIPPSYQLLRLSRVTRAPRSNM